MIKRKGTITIDTMDSKTCPNLKYSPPEKLTQTNIVYWCPLLKELKVQGGQNAIITKARRFFGEGCVIKTGNGYLVKPIKGYNKTTYQIISNECNCQFHKKTKLRCSHLLAIELYEFNKQWNRNI